MLNIEIEENPNEENEGTEVDVDNLENNTSMYTKKYRVVKTLLLLFAFIVYGLNFEMVGPTLEDLRIQMNVNYTEISFGLVLRNLSFLIFSLMFGIVILNRITQYSDMFMALASFIIMLCKFEKNNFLNSLRNSKNKNFEVQTGIFLILLVKN